VDFLLGFFENGRGFVLAWGVMEDFIKAGKRDQKGGHNGKYPTGSRNKINSKKSSRTSGSEGVYFSITDGMGEKDAIFGTGTK